MRSVCKRILSIILWEISELITQEQLALTDSRIFKLGGEVEYLTRHV